MRELSIGLGEYSIRYKYPTINTDTYRMVERMGRVDEIGRRMEWILGEEKRTWEVKEEKTRKKSIVYNL